MGSGKTTAGKKLASLTGWKFIDLDSEIEKKEDKSIPEIFSTLGEDYFRKTEAETLRSIKPDKSVIIATGGGAPCFYGNMDYMLSSGIVIYLKLTPGQLKQRLETDNTERPLLKEITDEKLPGFIEKKLEERENFYNRAHII
ncbi:MAG: shikimate kinase, partial [Bacteroidales bacterium]